MSDCFLYGAGVKVATHKVWKGVIPEVLLGVAEPLTITVTRGHYAALKPMMDVPKMLIAPIKKGQAIGKLRISLDGKVLAERPLVALVGVPESGFFKWLWDEFWACWESE